MKHPKYVLQSWGLWLTFLLSVVPIVAILVAWPLAVARETRWIEPHTLFWDTMGRGPGQMHGGCEMVGWRVGPIDVSIAAANAIMAIACLVVAGGWYTLLWRIGAWREQRRPGSFPPVPGA
jgi:hypothetical protein